MEYRSLGRTGIKVSPLTLGSMQFGWTADEDTSFQVLSAAWDAGINFIDTADIYSRWVAGNPGGVSETIIGKWWRQAGVARHRLVLATKVRGRMGESPNEEGLSRAHILHAAEESLRRLQTDYIDLYQCHWFDENTPIDETLSALDQLVRQGKVRTIGCSNFSAWRLMQALWTSDDRHLARFDCLQPHYSLVNRAEFERELVEVCLTYGVGVIPYSPLAGGFLSGKYTREQTEVGSQRNVRRYFTERNWKLLDEMARIGLELGGRSSSQIALAWLLQSPAVTSPIIGPRKLDQLEDNLAALSFTLSDEQMERLNKASDWRE